MNNPFLKKSIFISLLGHLTIFTIFSFSFGNVIPAANYTNVFFWGQLLGQVQVSQPQPRDLSPAKNILSVKPDTAALDKIATEQLLLSGYQLKPAFNLVFQPEKASFMEPPSVYAWPLKKKEPAIIFHPLLPYSFTLYFQDRQVAHVELMYSIVSEDLRNYILVKRKISSGNLEVDLLALRYIKHYLFIQKARLAPNTWQTVKIDLSAKND